MELHGFTITSLPSLYSHLCIHFFSKFEFTEDLFFLLLFLSFSSTFSFFLRTRTYFLPCLLWAFFAEKWGTPFIPLLTAFNYFVSFFSGIRCLEPTPTALTYKKKKNRRHAKVIHAFIPNLRNNSLYLLHPHDANIRSSTATINRQPSSAAAENTYQNDLTWNCDNLGKF